MVASSPNEKEQFPVLSEKALHLTGDILTHIGKFIKSIPKYPDQFKSDYESLLEKLDLLKEELDSLSREDSELYDWLKLIYNGLKYFFEGNTDMVMCRFFQTENLEKGRALLRAAAERVPAKLKTILNSAPESIDIRNILKQFALGLMVLASYSKAMGYMECGEYEEAAQCLEKALKLSRKLPPESGLVGTEDKAFLWWIKGLNYQYERGKFSDAADAFKKSAEIYQQIADNATLAGDKFEEGKAFSMKLICDRRASICLSLHRNVETSIEYQRSLKKINIIKADYLPGLLSVSSIEEIRAWREIVTGIESIRDTAKKMQSSSEFFGIDSEIFKRLYERSHRIKTNITTSLDGLSDIEKRRGTIEQTAMDSMDRDKYRTTLQDMVYEYKDDLLPAYQAAVEGVLENRAKIEAAAEEKRAIGEKVPEKPKIKELLDDASKEVDEANNLKTHLKGSYDSAAKLWNDAKPYTGKLVRASEFALACNPQTQTRPQPSR